MFGSSSTTSTRGAGFAIVFSRPRHGAATRLPSNRAEGDHPMTTTFHRFALGAGGTLIALGLAGVVYASTQNTAGGPGPFMGQRPPFARAGGMGPFAPLRRLAARLGLTDAQKAQLQTIPQSPPPHSKALP